MFRTPCVIAAVFFLTATLWAQPVWSAASEGEIAVLPAVPVIGTLANPAGGQSVLSREVIEKLPAGTGSINEMLRVLPDVQVGEAFRTTSQAGEILPPSISISGGKTFQNAFLIDGLRNESLLDPENQSITQPHDVAGHPLALFLDARLVEKITVYDSNVPARFGGFSGGVVDVESRDPGGNFGGQLSYRTTRAGLTRFHLAEDEEEPDFEIHNAAVELEVPLRPDLGVLGSYRILDSRLPRRHLGDSRTEERRKEDFFLKSSLALPDGRVNLTFAATPYEGDHFLPYAANSDFSIRGGGFQIGAEYEHLLPAGLLEIGGGYQWSRNDRSAPQNYLQWFATDSRPWGRRIDSEFSQEGGFGDIEKEQESISLRTSLILDERRTGPALHNARIGLELESVRGVFDRREEVAVYTGAVHNSLVICGEDTVACIDEEQYLSSRVRFPEEKVDVRMNLADLYLEDEVRIGRLTLHPGVRFSYDDFTDNFNAAPRFATAFDLFGDGRTVLVAGANRYYGRTLLTYKLREARLPGIPEYRSTTEGSFLASWDDVPFEEDGIYRFSRLDNPYDDELAGGVDQALLGGRLSLKYVRREGHDQLSSTEGPLRPDGLTVSTLNNKGRSRHQSVRLTWERQWQRHLLSLNGTWQETKTSNEWYEQELEDLFPSGRVWLDGRIVSQSDLPRNDYNRPWTANATYRGELPYGFSFTNVTRYRSGYRGVFTTDEVRATTPDQSRINPVTGDPVIEGLPVFRTRKLSGAVLFDWVLGWTSPGKYPLVLTVEVENVFNTRAETGAGKNTYELGRQFWTSAAWRF